MRYFKYEFTKLMRALTANEFSPYNLGTNGDPRGSIEQISVCIVSLVFTPPVRCSEVQGSCYQALSESD